MSFNKLSFSEHDLLPINALDDAEILHDGKLFTSILLINTAHKLQGS